ncbi:MAG: glycosyltransferase [Clostridia bacterium]|nr:glycosyltransferase [Clostridia bacterium]
MKILIAASNMVHINNFHREYIQGFKNEGHDVYIMASGEGADFDIGFKKRSLSFKNWRLSKKIKKIIKEEKFDIIYLHTSLCAFWVRYALRGLKERPRVINTVHGYLFGKGFSKLHNFIYLRCERLLRKQTDVVVVMNDEDYEIATKNNLASERVEKIDGMGVKFPHIPLERKNKENKKTNLVFVGEISKRKNQIFLVRAMKRLPDMTLTLVGDGAERKEIEKLIKKENLGTRVQITGFTKDVYSYLSRADIYVSASKIEGLPFNIMEAMWAGIPIAATSIKGHCDLLPSECLYPTDNEDEFVKLVNTILETDIKYDIQKYSFDAVFEKNMKLYEASSEKQEILAQ